MPAQRVEPLEQMLCRRTGRLRLVTAMVAQQLSAVWMHVPSARPRMERGVVPWVKLETLDPDRDPPRREGSQQCHGAGTLLGDF